VQVATDAEFPPTMELLKGPAAAVISKSLPILPVTAEITETVDVAFTSVSAIESLPPTLSAPRETTEAPRFLPRSRS